MATGTMPFRGETSAELSDEVLNRAPVPPVRLNLYVSPKVEEIILKALEKNCETRYQHAADIRTALKRLKRDMESARVGTMTAVAHAVQPQPWWRAKWALAGGGAALAGLLLVAIWFTLFRGRGEAIDSVDVLPFANATTNPDTDYLTTGITDT